MSDGATPLATCPHCGEPVTAADEFCESCGNDLNEPGAPDLMTPAPGDGLDQPPPEGSRAAEAPDGSARTHLITPPGAAEPATQAAPAAGEPSPYGPCAACGGEVGADGWCTVCGARAGNGRDHVTEQPSPAVAGVSDRGRVHTRNEDACALAADGDWAALVVCDGVSSSTDSDVASLAAAWAARDVLVQAPRAEAGSSPSARSDHWAEQLTAAARAAGDAAEEAAATVGGSGNPPSCTFVAAVADGAAVTVAWVGDSRAYWLADDGTAEQLSVDDSWATEQVRLGVAQDVAEAEPQAHAITRWLGLDSPEGDASTSTTTAAGPGWLLVCSDGLWNYCSSAAAGPPGGCPDRHAAADHNRSR